MSRMKLNGYNGENQQWQQPSPQQIQQQQQWKPRQFLSISPHMCTLSTLTVARVSNIWSWFFSSTLFGESIKIDQNKSSIRRALTICHIKIAMAFIDTRLFLPLQHDKPNANWIYHLNANSRSSSCYGLNSSATTILSATDFGQR